MTREKFLHGRYEVEPNDDGFGFFVHDSNCSLQYDDLSITFYGGGVQMSSLFGNDSLTFGSLAEFDELRDLITFLHGKANEKPNRDPIDEIQKEYPTFQPFGRSYMDS